MFTVDKICSRYSRLCNQKAKQWLKLFPSCFIMLMQRTPSQNPPPTENSGSSSYFIGPVVWLQVARANPLRRRRELEVGSWMLGVD
uniref:HDC14614 n=1 Tax=Drosophila melanogaster TaxID=7227 RepID=Q6IJM5_DROME|nr:TPA_inf: HDC14614 [Drosophila melanogaster]